MTRIPERNSIQSFAVWSKLKLLSFPPRMLQRLKCNVTHVRLCIRSRRLRRGGLRPGQFFGDTISASNACVVAATILGVAVAEYWFGHHQFSVFYPGRYRRPLLG